MIVAWLMLLVRVRSLVAVPATARLVSVELVVSTASLTVIVTVSPARMVPSRQMIGRRVVHAPAGLSTLTTVA